MLDMRADSLPYCIGGRLSGRYPFLFGNPAKAKKRRNSCPFNKILANAQKLGLHSLKWSEVGLGGKKWRIKWRYMARLGRMWWNHHIPSHRLAWTIRGG